MTNYAQFLESKKIIVDSQGITNFSINPNLFDYQKDIVKWALQKGRAAVFAGTGLGKTRIQLAWAANIPGKVLIFAPLAVSEQTIQEGRNIGINVKHVYEDKDIAEGINITNYERMEKFNLSHFTGIVLDESSILKAQMGKIRTALIDNTRFIPFKLACTATPAPNDYMELGNHAEFLGVMKQIEMLSIFFTHDGGNTSKWRLKGHAIGKFWEWVASWAVMLTNPNDLGYDGSKFDLPPLNIKQVTVSSKAPAGTLFSDIALTLQDRQQARRDSLLERVQAAAEIVNRSKDKKWLIWCNLNSESEMLTKCIEDAVEVKGSDDNDYKAKNLLGFANKEVRVLVSKPSIAGFGLNYQSCHNMVFVGLSDSFEEYYQAVRRCWRFGQKNQVNVYFITAQSEGAVVSNIKRKEKDFNEMLKGMISATQEITAANIRKTERQRDVYNPLIEMELPKWLKGAA